MQNEQVDLCLREATPEDEPFLLEVYASTRIEELEGFGWNDDQKRAFIKMQFTARERTYPRVDNRIILLNGCPVGRMMVDRGDASILLRDIALLTEYRNAGIGSRLITGANEGRYLSRQTDPTACRGHISRSAVVRAFGILSEAATKQPHIWK